MRASRAVAGTAAANVEAGRAVRGGEAGGVRTGRRRAALATAAALTVAALVAALLLWGPWQHDPSPASRPPAAAGADPEDPLLRERLGGLAALVIGDDPVLRACADPGRLPEPAATDPVDRVVAQVEAVRGLPADDARETL